MVPTEVVLPAAAPAEEAAHFLVRAARGFDHACYAVAAVLVFPALFFPYWGDLLGTLYGVLLFALGLSLAPLGRRAGDFLRSMCGAGKVLGGAAALLAICTVATGVLPGYAAAGSLGVALLVACRMGQGLAAGACGATQTSGGGSFAFAGLLAGAALGGGMMAVIASQLVHADFVAWGWRYPFCAAIAVHLVAGVARMRLAKS